MHHVIVGYGYVGYYLSKQLNQIANINVDAYARTQQFPLLPAVQLHLGDVTKVDFHPPSSYCLYYSVPPSLEGETDRLLAHFLSRIQTLPTKIIYLSSTGVYGETEGRWVNEESPLTALNDKQKRRIDAENQWRLFATKHTIPLLITRIGGIYGPSRIPIDAVKNRLPIIHRDEAPFVNLIDIHDLARILYQFMCLPHWAYDVVNVTNGKPDLSGCLQTWIQAYLGLPPLPVQSFQSTFETASNERRFFLSQHKKVAIDRLKNMLSNVSFLDYDAIKLYIGE